MANDKAFKIKNDLIATRYLGKNGTATASEEGYVITNSQFETLSEDFNVLASETLVSDITFKDDGTKAFIIGNSEDRVAAVDLSTAWDISTASTSTEFSPLISFDTSPLGLEFGNNGSKMYVAGNGGDSIYQFDLTTDWDVSTASHVSANDLDVSTETTAPVTLQFKPDGLTMFVLGSNNIFEYTLTSAWDLGTASYSTNTTGSLLAVGTLRGFEFTADGTSCFVLNINTEVITEYSVSPAWDVTGFTATGNTYDISGQTTTSLALAFGQSGKKMYVPTGDSDKVRQYTSFMPKTDLDLSTGNTFSTSTVGNHEITFSNPPASGKAIGFTLEVSNGGGFDISESYIDSKSVNVGSYETYPQGIFISPDGLELYTCGPISGDIIQYTLSTAWDVSTATYTRSYTGVTAYEAEPRGVHFKPDGFEMYVIGYNTSDDLHQFTLTTAWDISTASFTRTRALSEDTTPRGIRFNDDGTKFFILGDTTNTIREHGLTTAWDISTASSSADRTLDVSGQSANVRGFDFSDDGKTIFYGASNDLIYQYNLSSAWNLDTAIYASLTFNVQTAADPLVVQDIGGIFFSGEQNKFYVSDATGGAGSADINQFTAGTVGDAITWPTAIEWHGGASPTTEKGKEMYTFFTKDGGTIYYGKRAGGKFA